MGARSRSRWYFSIERDPRWRSVPRDGDVLGLAGWGLGRAPAPLVVAVARWRWRGGGGGGMDTWRGVGDRDGGAISDEARLNAGDPDPL